MASDSKLAFWSIIGMIISLSGIMLLIKYASEGKIGISIGIFYGLILGFIGLISSMILFAVFFDWVFIEIMKNKN